MRNLTMNRIKNVFLLLSTAVLVAGCADNATLHNIEAGIYTFAVVDFPVEDDDYAIPGDYNDWNNGDSGDGVTISIVGGEGETDPVILTSTSILFAITEVDTWTRSWYPATEGNSEEGFTGDMTNFEVTDLVLGVTGTIEIDGSTIPATITVTY